MLEIAALHLQPGMTDQQIAAKSRTYLDELLANQLKKLNSRSPVEIWIKQYTQTVDYILSILFKKHVPEAEYALIAIGGYGRNELFPKSDIDILIIKSNDSQNPQSLELFIQAAWNLGLDISQSVRNIDECVIDSKDDLNTLTSLIEARFIAGQEKLFQALNDTTYLMPPKAFLDAKIAEQAQRGEKENNDGKLEPNIKTGYGGLRDIQMIYWLNKYCRQQVDGLELKGLLTESEILELMENRHILWRIRYALHLINTSAKDKLSFQYQQKLAAIFYPNQQSDNMAVEAFMRVFYLACLKIRRINRLVAKFIDESLNSINETPVKLNADFTIINQRIALKTPSALKKRPELIWEAFIQIQENPEIISVSPQLARQFREEVPSLIDDKFRKDAKANRLFLKILNHPANIFPQIRRMHRYGILNQYIPAFNQVTGLMQFDLFHELTVDQHTLKLIYYLDHFKKADDKYPHTHAIMKSIQNPAILYLAAIFHDIGKGRQKDHSIIGAEIAEKYLLENTEISSTDGELLCFLVKHHLLLSITAQKKDISDQNIITQFAANFPNTDYLDYLYLLTLADISATNQTLWNSWRADLLSQLYLRTHQYLNDYQNDENTTIANLKIKSLALIDKDPIDIGQLWQHLPKTFFQGETASIIAKKTSALLDSDQHNIALQIQERPPRIFISATTSPDILFARATHFMEKNNLNITEARLFHDYMHQKSMQQYTFDDSNQLNDYLIKLLNQTISGNIAPKPLSKRLNSQNTHYFNTETQITFKQTANKQKTLLEISAKDRHGLLSSISRALLDHQIHVTHAKIATFGERVEDTFYITDKNGQAILDNHLLDQMKATIAYYIE